MSTENQFMGHIINYIDKKIRLIWFAILASIVIFGILAPNIEPQNVTPFPAYVVLTIYLCTVLIFAFILVSKNKFLTNIQPKAIFLSSSKNALQKYLNKQKLKPQNQQETNFISVAAQFEFRYSMLCVMTNVITICGLVLSLNTQDISHFILLSTFALLVLYFVMKPDVTILRNIASSMSHL